MHKKRKMPVLQSILYWGRGNSGLHATVSVTGCTKWEFVSGRLSMVSGHNLKTFSLPTADRLLKNRMSAALAMICCRVVTSAIVVIQHEMLAFITDHVGNAFEILCVLGDHE